MSVNAIQIPMARPVVGDMTGASLERYASNPNVTEADKIAEASKQFEAVLLRQILAAARKSVIHSGMEDTSATADIYQDMVTAQLAEAISQSGSLGLAQSLQVQVSRPKRGLGAGEQEEAETGGELRSVRELIHDGKRVRHD